MTLQNALTWLDDKQSFMTETLITWANINSGSYHPEGVKQMADTIADFASMLSAHVEFIDLPPIQLTSDKGDITPQPVGPALKFRCRPEAKKQVLLVGHLDTVFPKDSSFQTCQFLDENTLNGPGVADMKGGILTLLMGLMAFEQTPQACELGWTILLVPDEEVGSHSSYALLAQAATEHDIGLDYEPSTTPEGTLAGQRKGSGNFDLVITGKSAHAGRAFSEGRNAIVAASVAIDQLHQLNALNPNITLNVAKINGGTALNVVPDTTVLRFNIRTQTLEDETWCRTHIDHILQQLNQLDGIQAELRGKFTRPPKPLTGKTLQLFERVRDIGKTLSLDLTWQATGGVCDGNILAAHGLPNIDTLGVRGGNIHSDQEFVLLDSLPERAKLTCAILHHLACNKDFL